RRGFRAGAGQRGRHGTARDALPRRNGARLSVDRIATGTRRTPALSLPGKDGTTGMTQNNGSQTDVRRILIVDDHPVVRQGIKLMVNAQPDLTVVGEAQTEQDARRLVRELRPDALVVDLSLDQGDGFNVVRDVNAHFPHIRVLVLSMHDEAVYAERLLSQGASGYI